ncbi:MAG: hypothetical protein ABI310_02495 [Microbacteriaceae bacterium]
MSEEDSMSDPSNHDGESVQSVPATEHNQQPVEQPPVAQPPLQWVPPQPQDMPQSEYPQPAYAPPYVQQQPQPAAPEPGQPPYVQQQPRRQPPQPSAEAAPRRKSRTGLIVWLVSGGVFLLLLIAAIVGAVALTASHAPDRAVAAYLQALESGHAADALSLSGVHATSADLLLTDAAYRAATDRISHSTIGTTAVNGDTAAVTAELTQGTQRYTQTFSLEKTGTDLLFFPNWQLKPVQLGAVVVRLNGPSDLALKVAGIAAPSGATVELAALPGTYAVTPVTTSQWYTIKDESAVVTGFGSAGSKPVIMNVTLSEKGVVAATEAVNKYLDVCAASTEFLPPNCPFGAVGQDPAYTYSNQKWTLNARPVFEVGGWRSGGWVVATKTPGNATFTADVSNASGNGTSSTDPIPVRVTGYISKIDDSGATFTTLVAEPATA